MTFEPKTKYNETVNEIMEIAAALHSTNALRGRQLLACANRLDGELADREERIRTLEHNCQVFERVILKSAQAEHDLQARIERVRALLGTLDDEDAKALRAALDGETKEPLPITCTCAPLTDDKMVRLRDRLCPIHGKSEPKKGGVDGR